MSVDTGLTESGRARRQEEEPPPSRIEPSPDKASAGQRILKIPQSIIELVKAALGHLSSKQLERGGITPFPPAQRSEVDLAETREENLSQIPEFVASIDTPVNPSPPDIVIEANTEGIDLHIPGADFEQALNQCVLILAAEDMQNNPSIEMELTAEGTLEESQAVKRPSAASAQTDIAIYMAGILSRYIDDTDFSGTFRVEGSPLGAVVQNGAEPCFLRDVFAKHILTHDLDMLQEAKSNGGFFKPQISQREAAKTPALVPLMACIADGLERAIHERLAMRKRLHKAYAHYNDFGFVPTDDEEEADKQPYFDNQIESDEVVEAADGETKSSKAPTESYKKISLEQVEGDDLEALLEEIAKQFGAHLEHLHATLDQYTPQTQGEEDQLAIAQHLPEAGTLRQKKGQQLLETLCPRLYPDMLNAAALILGFVLAHYDQEPYNTPGRFDKHSIGEAIRSFGVGGLKQGFMRYIKAAEVGNHLLENSAKKALEDLIIWLSFPKGEHIGACHALMYEDVHIDAETPLNFNINQVIEQAGGGKEEPDALDHIAAIYIAFRRLIKASDKRGTNSRTTITWVLTKFTGFLNSRRIFMRGNNSEEEIPRLNGRLRDLIDMLVTHAHPHVAETNILMNVLIKIVSDPADTWIRKNTLEAFHQQFDDEIHPYADEAAEDRFLAWYEGPLREIESTSISSFRNDPERRQKMTQMAKRLKAFTKENARISQALIEWTIKTHDQLDAQLAELVIQALGDDVPETFRALTPTGMAFLTRVMGTRWALASTVV